MNRAVLPSSLRRPFLTALSVLLFSAFCCAARVEAQSAKTLFQQGQSAEASGDFDAAFNDYQKASQRNPKDLTYRTAYFRIRSSASAQHLEKGRQVLRAGDTQGALTEFLRASEIDPGNESASQEIAAMRQRQVQGVPAAAELSPEAFATQGALNSMASPVELKPVSNEPLTLHMGQDAKAVYQAIGRAAGINVLFDPDYTSKNIQVDLTNSTLMDGLRIVGILSNTFWRPITPNTIFVAQNTRSKRSDFDEQAVQTFYLTNAWQQNDLNDVQTALRNVLTQLKVYGVASQNAIVVKGTPDELLLAQKLISDLDKARPEVVVDIAVMEVSKNWRRTLGLSWPGSASVQIVPSTSSTTTTTGTGGTTGTTGTTTTTNPTIYNLAHLNSNDFSVSLGAATANLLLTDSNTRILQNPRLRATDMQKATMKIGERIPIATGSFSSGVGVGAVGGFPAAQTQFQYLDVGVEIEITPTVHSDGDVTLKMKIAVTAQSGSTTISGVTEPIIAQKATEEVVRLREGEANILSGILNQQDQVSWSGIPGLSSIPILKYLFGSKDHTITNDEVVFLMVPHVVRGADITPLNQRAVDTGSGTNVELRRLPLQGPGANAPPQVQPVTTHAIAPTAANIASAPGATASAAAPAALDQMRQGVGPAPQVPQTNLDVKQPTKAPAGTPPTAPPGPPAAGAQNGTAPKSADAPQNPAGGGVRLMLNSPGPVANGSAFQVPVIISGATDISAVPLQVQYDPAKVSFEGVAPGDFLTRDGQASGESHRDDGPGNLTLNLTRPRTANAGISGAGVVCVLNFKATSPGDTNIVITRAGAMNSKQQPLQAQGSQISVQVK